MTTATTETAMASNTPSPVREDENGLSAVSALDEAEPSPLSQHPETASVGAEEETAPTAEEKGKGIASNPAEQEVQSGVAPATAPAAEREGDEANGNEGARPALPPRPTTDRGIPTTTTNNQANANFDDDDEPLRILPPDSRRTAKTKLVLTFLGICFSVPLFALAALLLTSGSDYTYKVPTYTPAEVALIIGIISAVWHFSELVTYCVRISRHDRFRGIHPGAHVGVDLILALACGGGAAYLGVAVQRPLKETIAFCVEEFPHKSERHSTYFETCGYSYTLDFINKPLQLVNAILAMYALALVAHFVLFVWACVDVNARNQFVNPQQPAMPHMTFVSPPVQQQQAVPGFTGNTAPAPGAVPQFYYPYPMQQQQRMPQQHTASPAPAASATPGTAQ